jgi:hypothetical protein
MMVMMVSRARSRYSARYSVLTMSFCLLSPHDFFVSHAFVFLNDTLSQIVIIPGLTSSHLEQWSQNRCFKHRDEIWPPNLKLLFNLFNPTCRPAMYANQTRINPETGIEYGEEHGSMEPRIRAKGGLDGASSLFGGTIPLWNPLIEALSAFGYSPKNIFMQSYDWHLSLEALEARDGYFTNLKYTIESAYHQNDKRKVVLVCHSLGGVVFTWFSQFITARDPDWMETYVHANVLLGAPLLGAPKAINALLSGDIPDLHGPFSILKALILKDGNQFMSSFTKIMRNIESMMYMLPKGGDDFWASYAWDQEHNEVSDLSRLIKNPQKMSVLLASDLCKDANSIEEGSTVLEHPTFDAVFGNFSDIYRQRKPMFLDCSGRKKHKSISEAIDLLHQDLESMHTTSGGGVNVIKAMRRLRGLCQNGALL